MQVPALALAVPLVLVLPLATVAWQLPTQQRRRANVQTEEINLDLPPAERWRAFGQRNRARIIDRCQHLGRMYRASVGEEIARRWVQAADPGPELRTEYDGLIAAVDHSDVTLDCLLLTDMWQALDAPSFGCSGILAAMENGTVIHGRNIDYDMEATAQQYVKTSTIPGSKNTFFDGTLTRGGRPVAEFIAMVGSLGVHTGMRLGAYSVNSNARFHNHMLENLKAMEAGAKNFPWVLRSLLQNVSDFDAAVQLVEETPLNAPNYFILGGAGPYQGAVVTKDRFGTHEPSTPPTQWLNASQGVWHLVQTNDDLLSPPEDSRRGTALMRLSQSLQSQVSMDFIEGEMEADPIHNSDTLLTWIADPSAGVHRTLLVSTASVLASGLKKMAFRALHVPMPQELNSTLGKKAQSFLDR